MDTTELLFQSILDRLDRIEDKIAALEAEVGKGRVILLGFKPQWRGQSHASYKFFMNAFYGE